MIKIIQSDWQGCYSDNWKGILLDEAFSHPAKYSRALIRKIYKHIIAEGWVGVGDTVIDPFGGIAAGAIDAMQAGLNWIGVELEEKFVALGNQNILKWHSEYLNIVKKWGSAKIMQGDSRQLLQIIGGQHEICVASPPFGEGETRDRHKAQAGFVSDMLSRAYTKDRQGTTEGNLSHLHEGNFDAAISSPPYVNSIHDGNGIDVEKLTGNPAGANSQAFAEGYGQTIGQLGKMPEGKFDVSVSSPPYEENMNAQNKCGIDWEKAGRPDRTKPSQKRISPQVDGGMAYGKTDGQLGKESGETFWTAARQIVEQVFIALKPGGHAVWVVKPFVKKKAIVDFPGMWRQICESVGFETLHEHIAWQEKNYGTQLGVFGDETKHTKWSASFFRRLHANKYPELKINFEIVYCMRKPESFTRLTLDARNGNAELKTEIVK